MSRAKYAIRMKNRTAGDIMPQCNGSIGQQYNLNGQFDNAGGRLATVDRQFGNRDWQPKAARTGAAGIEVEDAAAPLGQALVRVAVDHHVDPLGSRVEADGGDVVHREQVQAGD